MSWESWTFVLQDLQKRSCGEPSCGLCVQAAVAALIADDEPCALQLGKDYHRAEPPDVRFLWVLDAPKAPASMDVAGQPGEATDQFIRITYSAVRNFR